MGNKEAAHVLDKVAERKVLYNAMKQRAAKAGARGFTKKDMKKVLGDVEHSGQFSHKEMHELGEALIGGPANSRIIREHAAGSDGHSNANVEHRSRFNKHRTFDEILGRDRTTRFDSSVENQPGSASQKVSKILTFENSNKAIRQAEEKRVSVSQRARNKVRYLAEEEESDGKEINQTQDRDISLSEEQIKRLQFLQSDQAVKDAQAEEVAVSTEAKKKAKASKENDEKKEKKRIMRAKEYAASLSEKQVKRLEFLQSDKAVRDAQDQQVAAEQHVEKKEEDLEVEKKAELDEQSVGVKATEDVSLSEEQVKRLEFIQSNEAVREAQSEKVVAKLANDPREGMSTSFGYVPEYLKNFNEGADITKIKSLIAEIQEDKNKDKEDEEDEDDDMKKDDQQKQKYKMAA